MADRSRARVAAVTTVRDAALVVAGCTALALGFNALRPGGIPVIQRKPYELLVPCPVISAQVDPIEPADPRIGARETLRVDARDSAESAAWRLPEAIQLPYDYLEPVAEAAVRSVASSGARRVVVYGDGESPDSGEQLARELASKGIRNVFFVRGGAPALRQRSLAR